MAREKEDTPLDTWNSGIYRLLFEDAILVKSTTDGSCMNSVKLPSSAYSEPSILFMQAPLSWLEYDKSTHTHLIYDASASAQSEYWQLIHHTLNFWHQLTLEENNPFAGSRICLMGHHGRHIQNPGNPGIRSIKLQHDHMVALPQHLPGDFYNAAEFGLPDEKNLMLLQKSAVPYTLQNFTAFLNDTFNFPVSIRPQPPHGYEFTVPNQPLALTEGLFKHFRAYKAAMEASEWIERGEIGERYVDKFNISVESKKGYIVQPAFTLYLLVNSPSQLHVIVSPNLVGIGGPERAGILLKRGKKYPSHLSDDDLKVFLKQLENELLN
jgi:hypothetical protein